MEKEVKPRMGRSTWKQFAFQILNSTHLQYFSKMDKVCIILCSSVLMFHKGKVLILYAVMSANFNVYTHQ